MPSKWYGQEMIDEIKRNYDKRVGQAGDVLKRELKAVLSKPGQTVTYISKYGNSVKKVLPSAPGQAPAKITGTLRRSVFKKLQRRKNRCRVGAKGLVLQRGVPGHNIEPRPFLDIALSNVTAQIASILTAPLPEKSSPASTPTIDSAIQI
jgi:hypothetical protein